MDTDLFAYMHRKRSPKFNEDVVKGLACLDIKDAQAYVDNIINCGVSQYPEGFEFVRSERCNPLEEYNVVTKSRNGPNRVFDLARSDVYLVKYLFRNHGKDLPPCYMYLPFVRQAGMLYITGKQFAVSPVMGDIAFSTSENDVFIRMPRAPVTFNRSTSWLVIDGVRVSKYVIWSSLHNKGGKRSKNRSSLIYLGRVQSTLAHYLFCKYGFYETFDKYTNAQPVVMRESEYDKELYPESEYIVCSSAKNKPEGLRGRREYAQIATDLIVVVKRQHFTPLVESLIVGFFYVIDHFPDHVNEPADVGDSDMWKVFMGYIQFGDEPSHGKLVEDVNTHLKSLDGYVDHEVKKTLMEVEVFCENLYDLFVHMMLNMPSMLEQNATQVASLYGKRLEVLRYLLRNINNAMFEFLFKITSNTKKVFTNKDYEDILRTYFKPRLIHGITTGSEHPEVSSVSNPSDNLFFKITSVIVQQSDMHGRGKSQETKPVGPTMFLDASYAEVTGFCSLPKSNPIGNSRLNPCVSLGPHHTVLRKEKFKPLLDGVQRLIQRN